MKTPPEVLKERIKCMNDVCEYCGGRATRWERTPKGPNSAGNYTHQSIDTPNAQVLCRASSIISRHKFEEAMQ